MCNRASELTRNELKFLTMYACGLWPSDIAVTAGMTEFTVNLYLHSASKKLNAKHPGHAVALALALGLINEEMVLSLKKNSWLLSRDQ